MAYAKDTWKDLWKNYDLGCTEFKYTDDRNNSELEPNQWSNKITYQGWHIFLMTSVILY